MKSIIGSIRQVFLIAIGLIPIIMNFSCTYSPPVFSSFDDYPIYSERDLEMVYTPEKTGFRIWSPAAEAAEVIIYNQWNDSIASRIIKMEPAVSGTWMATYKGDNIGKYYTFKVKYQGKWLAESPGIYAKATSVNGKKAYIFDPSQTNPKDWSTDVKPKLNSFADIVLYELQIRDMSINPNSGIKEKGKYVGLAEENTVNADGFSTGLAHLKEMGVTHIHILPCFDFRSIDETRLSENKYNWGYDPENFNIPEGSFSTDPYDPIIRVIEMKQMIQNMHKNGMRVVMDVVYNHTGVSKNSNFNRIAPGYFYRQTKDGKFSNASGCGNETASERPMMRQYIVESVKYWVKEYHIDGFRFDLMGIHDVETMNLVKNELQQIDPTLFVYGEGWLAGDSPLPEKLRAIKSNIPLMPGIAAFCDEMRDGLKGHWGDLLDRGFVSGKPNMEESVKFGIVGASKHQDIDYSRVNYSKSPWTISPLQCINYVSCHDNHTLYDKLRLSVPEASQLDLIKMNRLANLIVLTSQGIPFLHNGVEFLRSKKGVENSFESPDDINQIDWNLKTINSSEVVFYKNLIQLRKAHPAFRMCSAEEVNKNLRFLKGIEPGVIAYTINARSVGDTWNKVLLIFNGNSEPVQVKCPQPGYKILYDGFRFVNDSIPFESAQMVKVPAISGMILVVD